MLQLSPDQNNSMMQMTLPTSISAQKHFHLYIPHCYGKVSKAMLKWMNGKECYVGSMIREDCNKDSKDSKWIITTEVSNDLRYFYEIESKEGGVFNKLKGFFVSNTGLIEEHISREMIQLPILRDVFGNDPEEKDVINVYRMLFADILHAIHTKEDFILALDEFEMKHARNILNFLKRYTHELASNIMNCLKKDGNVWQALYVVFFLSSIYDEVSSFEYHNFDQSKVKYVLETLEKLKIDEHLGKFWSCRVTEVMVLLTRKCCSSNYTRWHEFVWFCCYSLPSDQIMKSRSSFYGTPIPDMLNKTITRVIECVGVRNGIDEIVLELLKHSKSFDTLFQVYRTLTKSAPGSQLCNCIQGTVILSIKDILTSASLDWLINIINSVKANQTLMEELSHDFCCALIRSLKENKGSKEEKKRVHGLILTIKFLSR